MALYSTFATVGSIKEVFPTTPKINVFINTANVAMPFPTTIGNNIFFNTSNNALAFPTTRIEYVYPVTANTSNAFVVTPNPDDAKLLELKFGTFEISTDYSSVNVLDNTGEYVAVTNPGGYNPEGDAPDVNRAKRSEILLWTVYKNHSVTKDVLIFPSSQAQESDVDYVYPLPITSKGIYEIILIAAPVGSVYADSQTETLDQYAKAQQGWYINSAGQTFDPVLVTCLNNKRWDFLTGVMCGNCDEDYLQFYADYVGMLNANEIQDWDNAEILYQKLLTKCSEIGCDCGC
jgi:hypothetical protein